MAIVVGVSSFRKRNGESSNCTLLTRDTRTECREICMYSLKESWPCFREYRVCVENIQLNRERIAHAVEYKCIIMEGKYYNVFFEFEVGEDSAIRKRGTLSMLTTWMVIECVLSELLFANECNLFRGAILANWESPKQSSYFWVIAYLRVLRRLKTCPSPPLRVRLQRLILVRSCRR